MATSFVIESAWPQTRELRLLSKVCRGEAKLGYRILAQSKLNVAEVPRAGCLPRYPRVRFVLCTSESLERP